MLRNRNSARSHAEDSIGVGGWMPQDSELMAGTGEWTNMQEVVRRSFKACFDQISFQNRHIAELKEEIASLRMDLRSRATISDLNKLLASANQERDKDAVKKRFSSHADYQVLADIKAELASKASIVYVDSLRTRGAVKNVPSDSQTDLVARLTSTISDIKARIELLEEKIQTNNAHKSNNLSNNESMYLKEELESLHLQMASKMSRSEFIQLTSSKGKPDSDAVGVREMRTEIESLSDALRRVEIKLSERDKSLQSWSLRHNDKETPLDTCNIDPFGVVLSKVSDLIRSSAFVLERQRAESQRLLKLEESLSKEGRGQNVAEQVQILSVVLEEQRSRLDALVTGSTVITPIQRDLIRQQQRLDEVSAYLELPQPSTLKQRLHNISKVVIENIEEKLTASSTEYQRLTQKLELLSRSQGILDMKISALNEVKSLPNNLPVEVQSLADIVQELDRKVNRIHKAQKSFSPELSSLFSRLTEHEVRIVSIEENAYIDRAPKASEVTGEQFKSSKHELNTLVEEVSQLSGLRLKKKELKRQSESGSD